MAKANKKPKNPSHSYVDGFKSGMLKGLADRANKSPEGLKEAKKLLKQAQKDGFLDGGLKLELVDRPRYEIVET